MILPSDIERTCEEVQQHVLSTVEGMRSGSASSPIGFTETGHQP